MPCAHNIHTYTHAHTHTHTHTHTHAHTHRHTHTHHTTTPQPTHPTPTHTPTHTHTHTHTHSHTHTYIYTVCIKYILTKLRISHEGKDSAWFVIDVKTQCIIFLWQLNDEMRVSIHKRTRCILYKDHKHQQLQD